MGDVVLHTIAEQEVAGHLGIRCIPVRGGVELKEVEQRQGCYELWKSPDPVFVDGQVYARQGAAREEDTEEKCMQGNA